MRLLKIVLIIGCFLLAIPSAYAVDDDFGSARKIESQHFVIFYTPGLDQLSLLEKLDIGPAEIAFSEGSSQEGGGLAVALDTLYNIVMKNLDMYLYSLKGNIKVCQDRDQLNKVYASIFGSELQSSSFYIFDYNTIYISADDFTKEVLGHEIAHMIISNYFVVQPPPKVAEILSGYVEYQLRKSSR
jgi:hypothetical protein